MRNGVRHGFHHSNTIENYFSILKRGITGTFQHVSEAHLSRYMCEFDFLYSKRADLGVIRLITSSRRRAASSSFRGSSDDI